MEDFGPMIAVAAEIERIGLSLSDMPGIAFSESYGIDQFLARLRALPTGSTWHDIFPELPKEFRSPMDQARNRPYVPLGPWDYQDLPSAGALQVGAIDQQTPIDPTQLLAETQNHGHKIYAVGFRSDLGSTQAILVLERGTTDEDLTALIRWIKAHSRLELRGIPRTTAFR